MADRDPGDENQPRSFYKDLNERLEKKTVSDEMGDLVARIAAPWNVRFNRVDSPTPNHVILTLQVDGPDDRVTFVVTLVETERDEIK